MEAVFYLEFFEMSLAEKAEALAGEGRFDLCTGVPGSVYKSQIPLFKTLMTNACSFDCKYCQNRCNSRKIYAYEPKELAQVFMELQSTGQVEGLFLSSGAAADADSIMQKMVEAVRLVREPYGFKGYIHLKVLPGVSKDLIEQAGKYADRLSINIEAPTKSHLLELSSTKDFDLDIIKRQKWIKEIKPRAGQTTQMVVGAGDETDLDILKAAEREYADLGLRRVYYSPFTPLQGTPLKEKEPVSPDRTRRLYNVDFMIRQYGIPLKEFKEVMVGENLPPGDPKVSLALERFDKPLDVNEADFEDLVRVPGIGPTTAYLMTALKGLKTKRRLRSVGVPKRAEPFLKIDGHSQKRLTG